MAHHSNRTRQRLLLTATPLLVLTVLSTAREVSPPQIWHAAWHAATNAAEQVHSHYLMQNAHVVPAMVAALKDASTFEVRRCVPGVSSLGVVQFIDGHLASCSWDRGLGFICGTGMSDFESTRRGYVADFVQWAPALDTPPRGLMRPRDFLLTSHGLELSRSLRVSVLLFLFTAIEREREWSTALYTAADDDVLWWIGSTNALWWHEVDDDLVLLGRDGSERRVIWDRSVGRLFAVR